MKKNKNKVSSKNNFVKNRQNLVNKMSDALNIKYSNFFQAANYDTQSLKDDIGKLLSTQYYSKDPRDVFKPIEQNILEIVKQKNPNLQVKVKKARKLPEIKYTKDKYQEADEAGKAIENDKEIKKPKNNNIAQKKGVSKGNKDKNSKIKGNEKNKNDDKDNKGEINTEKSKGDNINNKKEKNKEIKNDENIKNKGMSDSMYKIENEYGVKHIIF